MFQHKLNAAVAKTTQAIVKNYRLVWRNCTHDLKYQNYINITAYTQRMLSDSCRFLVSANTALKFDIINYIRPLKILYHYV